MSHGASDRAQATPPPVGMPLPVRRQARTTGANSSAPTDMHQVNSLLSRRLITCGKCHLYTADFRGVVSQPSRRGNGPSSVGLLTVTLLLACGSVQAASVPGLETLQAGANRVRAGRAAGLDLSGPRMTTAGTHPEALRLDTVRAWGSIPGVTGVRDALEPEPADSLTPRTEFNVRRQSSSELVHVARKFQRTGLPVVRLWASGRNLLAIGANPPWQARDLLHAEGSRLTDGG
jgi:hypothetical protein